MSPSVYPFVVALILSAVLGASLLAADLGGSWSLVAAWAAFFALCTGLLRMQQRQGPRR